jgi:hypothetical protein
MVATSEEISAGESHARRILRYTLQKLTLYKSHRLKVTVFVYNIIAKGHCKYIRAGNNGLRGIAQAARSG